MSLEQINLAKRCSRCQEPVSRGWRQCPTCNNVLQDQFPKMWKTAVLICGAGVVLFLLLIRFGH